MTRIHDNEVNKISEWNLLHDIINPPKCTHNLNWHYSTILDEWMDTRKGKSKFKKLLILLDSGYIYTIVIGRRVEKLHPDKYNMM